MPDNQFVKAKITGKTLSSGTWLYSWKEQVQAVVTGVDADPLSFRRGTSTNNPAVELNNTEVALDTVVFLRERGSYKNQMRYEFTAPAGTNTSETSSSGTSCYWAAGLTTADCLRMTIVSVAGRCSEISTSQSIPLVWSSGNSRWQSATDAFVGTGSGGNGTVTFVVTNGLPTSTIDGVYGIFLGCDGSGGLLFAFGGAVLCGGTNVLCSNGFVVRFACQCCSISGWSGPAWYCVREAGTEDSCLALELLETDRCNASIEICSGPYETEMAANAVCGPTPDNFDVTCGAQTYTFPGQYTITASGNTIACGASSAATGTSTITYAGIVGGYHTWTGSGLFSVTNNGDCTCTEYTDLLLYWRVRIKCVSPNNWETHIELSCNNSTWADVAQPGPSDIEAGDTYDLTDPGVGTAGVGGCPAGLCDFQFHMTSVA